MVERDVARWRLAALLASMACGAAAGTMVVAELANPPQNAAGSSERSREAPRTKLAGPVKQILTWPASIPHVPPHVDEELDSWPGMLPLRSMVGVDVDRRESSEVPCRLE